MENPLKDKKKILLGVLLCVFAAAFAYRIANPYRQGRVSELTYTGAKTRPSSGTGSPARSGKESGVQDVRMDLFLSAAPHSGKVTRNIFLSEEPEEKKPAPSQSQAPPPTQSPEPKLTPEMSERLKVKQDLSRFRTFGYLESRTEKTLFLERGDEILVLKKGDRIDGKYLVKEITKDRLLLRAENIKEDVHIDLGQF